MQESFNNHQDQSTNFEPPAQLNVFINEKGELEYNCDWDSNESGLSGMASIFYQIMFADLCPEILREIKQQCVSNDMESDYLTIVELISRYSQNLGQGEDEEVVVSPEQSYNI